MVRLPSSPKSSGRLVLRWAPSVMTWATPRASIIVPSVTMMDGIRIRMTKSAFRPPTARAPPSARPMASQVGSPSPDDSAIGAAGRLRQPDREDARQRDDATDGQVEVARHQQEGDADAEGDDGPVVGDQVEHVEGLEEVGHEDGRDEEQADGHDPDEDGDERLVAQTLGAPAGSAG